MSYQIRKIKPLIVLALVVTAGFSVWRSGYLQEGIDWVKHYAFVTKAEISRMDKILGSQEETESINEPTIAAGELEVHFIDVGNADAILLLCDGEAMLVDAGENNQGDEVVDYLQNQGVSDLEYAVGTHPHSDHIGGLDTVLYSVPTETVLMPAKEHTTETYTDVLDAIDSTGVTLDIPKVGDHFQLGSAQITVLSPDREWEDLNDNSIVLLVENGEDSFILTGDAGIDPERVMLDAGLVSEADVLKIGHPGSSTASSYRWLSAILPDYCIITCSADNKHEHPHDEVLSRLNDLAKVKGTITYRSDLNGTIIAYSTGDDNIKFETEK